MPQLPAADYYNRAVTSKAIDDSVAGLISKAIMKAQSLIFTHPHKACQSIETAQQDIQCLESLSAIAIPTEDHRVLPYYKFNQKTPGVTEKIALISESCLISRLETFVQAKFTTIDDYLEQRNTFCIQSDAIIKLPKHGQIAELIRETLGLTLSICLGLKTTDFMLISYDEKPALYIPFADIRPLGDYAQGQLFTKTSASLGLKNWTNGWGGFFRNSSPPPTEDNDVYQHYSTVNPIGEGLQADRFLDDFAKALLLMYLTNDTDTVGKHNQNKGIIEDKSLFVFDQSYRPDSPLALDSRLSLKPVGLVRLSRHNIGRNRTLLEDSSLKEKAALFLKAESMVLPFLEHLVSMRSTLLKKITATDQPSLTIDLRKLCEEINLIEESLLPRLKTIKSVLPSSDNTLAEESAIGILILEKLLNQPMIFNEQGRPYKNPWTDSHSNKILRISRLNDDFFEIECLCSVKKQQLALINRYLGEPFIEQRAERFLKIQEKQLVKIDECLIYPECHERLDIQCNYLALADLKQIANAYASEGTQPILEPITTFLEAIEKKDCIDQEKNAFMLKLLNILQELQKKADKKGFVSHVLKKYLFEMQRQLRLQIAGKDCLEVIDKAFLAALKFDRMGLFNRLLLGAIEHQQLDSLPFKQFLMHCIQASAENYTYHQAKNLSQAIAQKAESLLKDFSCAKKETDPYDSLLASTLF